jgi:hypothetical protein
MLHEIEPFYGWLPLYSHEADEHSPFHTTQHNLFEYDRRIYTYPAHPLWDSIESESLLVKILYANYDEGYAIVELLGEWNDLHENDFKLLCEKCLTYLVDGGVRRFILICENVFNVYLDADDYYEAFTDELDGGWMCLLRARPAVLDEMTRYRISPYFYWNPALDELRWRKLKPWELLAVVEQGMNRLLG